MNWTKIIIEIAIYLCVLGTIIYAFWFLNREMGVKGLFLGYIVLAGVVGLYLFFSGFLWQEPLITVLGGIIVAVMILIGVRVFKKAKARFHASSDSKGIPQKKRPSSKEELQIIYQALDEVVNDDSLIGQLEFNERFLREPILLSSEAAIFRNFYDCYTDVYGNDSIKIADFLSLFYCNGSKEHFKQGTFNKGQQRYSKGAVAFEKMKKELIAIKM